MYTKVLFSTEAKIDLGVSSPEKNVYKIQMAKQSKLTNPVLFSEDAIIILILPKSYFSFFYNVLISLTLLSKTKDSYIVYEYHYWMMFFFKKNFHQEEIKPGDVLTANSEMYSFFYGGLLWKNVFDYDQSVAKCGHLSDAEGSIRCTVKNVMNILWILNS